MKRFTLFYDKIGVTVHLPTLNSRLSTKATYPVSNVTAVEKCSTVERLLVAQFLLLWPSWWFLCSSAWHILFAIGTAAAACPTKAEGSQTSANKGSTCWRKTLIYFVSVLTSIQHVIKPLINCDLCIYFCVWSSVFPFDSNVENSCMLTRRSTAVVVITP